MSIVFIEQAPVAVLNGTYAHPSPQDKEKLREVLGSDPMVFKVCLGDNSPEIQKPSSYRDILDLSRWVVRLGSSFLSAVDEEGPYAVAQEHSAEHIDGISVPTYWQGHHTCRTAVNPASKFAISRYLLDIASVPELVDRANRQKEGPDEGWEVSTFVHQKIGFGNALRKVAQVEGVAMPGETLFFKNGVDLTLPVEAGKRVEVITHEFWSVSPDTGEFIRSRRELNLTRIF